MSYVHHLSLSTTTPDFDLLVSGPETPTFLASLFTVLKHFTQAQFNTATTMAEIHMTLLHNLVSVILCMVHSK